MRIRFAWLLPLVQLLLAITLLYWNRFDTKQGLYDTLYASTPALLCGGINAPAIFLSAGAHFFEHVDRALPTIFGLDLVYALYLAGIVILWSIVGRMLDKRTASHGVETRWSLTKILWAGLPLTAMALILLYFGVHGFLTPWRWNNRVGNLLQSTFYVGWSLVLLYLPAVQSRRYFSR
jgi:hypothetical protein